MMVCAHYHLFSQFLTPLNFSLNMLRLARFPVRSITRNFKPVIPALRFLPIRFYSTPDKELKNILKEEIEIVKQIPNDLDNSYKDYLTNNKIEIDAKEGSSNVELTKPLNNGEILKVFFDIDEVTDIPVDELTDEDGEMKDVDFDEGMNSVDSLLCSIKVVVVKPNDEALYMNLFLQSSESAFLVDFITPKTSGAEFLQQARQGDFLDKLQYQGPRFSELDESIQIGFENYLESIGVNHELADFILSFSELKEENEYRQWLGKVSSFF